MILIKAIHLRDHQVAQHWHPAMSMLKSEPNLGVVKLIVLIVACARVQVGP